MMKSPLLGVLVLCAVCDAALDFGYHDHQAMEKFLRQMESDYPNLTRLYSIGKSVGGAELWVMAVGESPREQVLLRPNVKYVANMHGNEVTGREMLLHLIQYLVSNYGSNNTITNFLNTTTVHIMPTMNPDGFAVSYEGNCTGVIGRLNKRNYNLNRNFPDQFVENPDPIQPETEHVMKWIEDIPFVLSANIHGGVEVVNYPWDSYAGAQNVPKYSASPDDDVFIHISKVYSYSHPTMHLGLPCPDDIQPERFKDGITNGAAWYTVTGGMQDYNYIHASCMEVLIEMTCCKYPQRDTLPKHWQDNRDPLINYLMEVHRGVKGLVLDMNNNPIAGASVVVQGRDEIVFRTTKKGEYWRILLPGEYTFQFTANNFLTLTKKVTVVERRVLRLDVKLRGRDSVGCASCLQSFTYGIALASVFSFYTSLCL